MTRVETIEQLAGLGMNAVFVDRIGLAWQVVALGADWSHTKGQSDTRRNGFVQAGNHVVYEASALASSLPARLVDDGRPEPLEAEPMTYAEAAATKGWGYPTATARKPHYFEDGRSLCGKYGSFGIPLTPDSGNPQPDDCTACSKRLRSRRPA